MFYADGDSQAGLETFHNGCKFPYVGKGLYFVFLQDSYSNKQVNLLLYSDDIPNKIRNIICDTLTASNRFAMILDSDDNKIYVGHDNIDYYWEYAKVFYIK